MTNIAWVLNPDGTFGEVWNPTTGCSPVSPGCLNCYADELHTKRHCAYVAHSGVDKNGKPMAKQYAKPFSEIQVLDEERLMMPTRWKKPRTVFVDSMGDLYHKDVPVETIRAVYDVMQMCPQHTFIICTKRPERIVPVLYGEEGGWYLGGGDYLPNVWHLASVEDQQTANERIPELLKLMEQSSGWQGVGISAEPLLAAVDLTRIGGDQFGWGRIDGLNGLRYNRANALDEGCEWETTPVPRLGIVIVGGESGKRARPMNPNWPRKLRDDCAAAGIPFFFKQQGEWAEEEVKPGGDLGGEMRRGKVVIVKAVGENNGHFERGDAFMRRVGQKQAGNALDGRRHSELPWGPKGEVGVISNR